MLQKALRLPAPEDSEDECAAAGFKRVARGESRRAFFGDSEYECVALCRVQARRLRIEKSEQL